jgi:signal transduction histidine kinase
MAGMGAAGPSSTSTRVGGRVPEVLLVAGALLVGVNVGILAVTGHADPFLTATHVVTLVAATLVRRRRPDLLSSVWYAAVAALSAGGGAADSAVASLQAVGAGAAVLVGANLVTAEVGLLGALSLALLIAAFPEGWLESPRQRRVLWTAAALALPVPVLATVAASTVPLPAYLGTGAVPNPWQLIPTSLTGEVAAGVIGVSALVFLAGPAILVARYRRAGPLTRRRMRWLLLPIVLLAATLPANAFLTGSTGLISWVLFLLVSLSGDVAATLGILAPPRVDADRAVLRTGVFALLWLIIAGVYVAVATIVGVTAGRALPVDWSVAIACVAALLFQPARRRLERLADQWVFGRRADPGLVVARLGETLAGTIDLDQLLPKMAEALEQGLGLTWARVRLEPEPDDADVAVPVVLDGEVLGVVECGPKLKGAWTDEDRAVVTTFAGQAALAVRNVRLAGTLAARAAEVAESRARLVRAQESERRRIERNIHDGVQQDLVALIGLAGLARRHLERGGTLDPEALSTDLAGLQAGMQQLLLELRELAAGVHPSVLSDHGLAAAVESLVTRHPVSTQLTIDPALRGQRFPDDIEGAAYFTIAEALANSLKHASATAVDVELTRSNGSLLATVRDDGAGFANPPRTSGGLDNLAARTRAVGGELNVTSAPGSGTTVLARFDVCVPEPRDEAPA